MEEGTKAGFWDCFKVLTNIDKMKCNLNNRVELENLVTAFEKIVVCLGYRSEFYDYVFTYNLLRSKGWSSAKYQEIYDEVCQVIELHSKNPKNWVLPFLDI